MKILRNIFVIALILIIIVPLGFFGYIKYQFNSLENDTYEYLLKNYNVNEIQKVEVSLTKASYLYAAFVTFKDEPGHVYEYIRIDGKIRQGGPFPNVEDAHKYKHLEPKE